LPPQPDKKPLKTFGFLGFFVRIWLEISLVEAVGGKSQRKIGKAQ
jgi:hypothetical protein